MPMRDFPKSKPKGHVQEGCEQISGYRNVNNLHTYIKRGWPSIKKTKEKSCDIKGGGQQKAVESIGISILMME